MTMLFVKHTVSDYAGWKQGYDSAKEVRQMGGVVGASVYRDPSNPNTLIVTHQFKSLDAAQAFATSDELKSAMEKAGVVGMPEIWFGEEVESTSL